MWYVKYLMPTILDGRKTREALMEPLMRRIKKLGFTPTLAIIQVGSRADSTAFIRAKKSFAAKIGIEVQHVELPETVSQGELMAKIQECNADKNIHGIIMQLPLPAAMNRNLVIDAIDPRKDVDALTSTSVKRWNVGDASAQDALFPATARGIRELLGYQGISLEGLDVTVVGRSALVGTPIAAMARSEGAHVTVAHSKTADLIETTKPADILIVAVGRPKLIGPKHVSKGQVIVDVGITRDGSDALSGDVDFEAVKDATVAISPVPGGVGPMTVFALFENLVDLCENKNNHVTK